jgi:hypothetical protein
MILPLLLLLCAGPQRGASCVIGCSGEIVAPVSIDATAKGFSMGTIREEPALKVHRSRTMETLDGKPCRVYTLVLE